MIGTFPALKLNIEEYSAIKNYLLNYKDRLEPKPRGFDGKWKEENLVHINGLRFRMLFAYYPRI